MRHVPKAWPRVLGQAFVLRALVRTPLLAGRSRTTDATPDHRQRPPTTVRTVVAHSNT